eukprot:SAG31_NODE_460_length_15364_cov_11.851294_9_plen_154_part_00
MCVCVFLKKAGLAGSLACRRLSWLLVGCWHAVAGYPAASGSPPPLAPPEMPLAVRLLPPATVWPCSKTTTKTTTTTMLYNGSIIQSDFIKKKIGSAVTYFRPVRPVPPSKLILNNLILNLYTTCIYVDSYRQVQAETPAELNLAIWPGPRPSR